MLEAGDTLWAGLVIDSVCHDILEFAGNVMINSIKQAPSSKTTQHAPFPSFYHVLISRICHDTRPIRQTQL